MMETSVLMTQFLVDEEQVFLCLDLSAEHATLYDATFVDW